MLAQRVPLRPWRIHQTRRRPRSAGDGMAGRRRRLDVELVRRRLAKSRAEAQRLVAAGQVLVSGAVAHKPARLVDPAEAVTVAGERPRYVSRGGFKLEAALARFGIDPRGARAIDAGASTGGFTDCLLQHGAASVIAIDVGRNQLHERLRADRRVTSLERTDVRAVDLSAIGGPAALVVADLAFISLRRVAAHLRRLAAGDLVVLVKPQFEAGKAEADKGRGVIRDPATRRRALTTAASALRDAGAAVLAVTASPITGASGNAEFFVHASVRPGARGIRGLSLDSAVREAVARAPAAGRR